MKIKSINPATEEVNKELDLFSEKQVIQIAKESKKAFLQWKKLSISERTTYLRKLATVLKDKKQEYAKLITLEMGKPILQSISEIEKCALTAEYYADNAEKWLQDEMINTEAKKSFVAHQPLGVILSIMPWNFPFWQLIRFAVPALAVGNVSILRHSSSVPMCAMAIEEAFTLAGFPENVFRTIITEHDVIKKLARKNLIDGLSLTGSVEAGRQVGIIAGKNIKKSVFELGGSDPFIVCSDADIDVTAKAAVEGRTINSGQSCISSKRFIVVKEVAEKFITKFVENMKLQSVGNPLNEKTTIGPMANKHQLELLEKQVNDSVAMGAKIEVGGKRVSGKGYFYEPTIMTNIKKNMPVFKQEVFGPVAPVIIVRTEKEAIKLANDSRLGLGASIWTKDIAKGEKMAREIESGMVFVNKIVRSDPRLPFGGIKDSGIGRELSRYGLLEFTNIKSIVID